MAVMPYGGEYQTSIKVIAFIFTIALTVLDILMFAMFDIEN